MGIEILVVGIIVTSVVALVVSAVAIERATAAEEEVAKLRRLVELRT